MYLFITFWHFYSSILCSTADVQCQCASVPVCHITVADAFHVSQARAPQQTVFAGVEWQQQIAHPVGVVDCLAEYGTFLLLDPLSLHFLAENWPQPVLLWCQLQGTHFSSAGWPSHFLTAKQKSITDLQPRLAFTQSGHRTEPSRWGGKCSTLNWICLRC